MKSIATILVAIVMAVAAFAHGGFVNQRKPVQAKSHLQQPKAASDSTKTLQPFSEKELEGTVEVSFMINTEGKVQILKINASSPSLVDYVVKKLNKIQLTDSDSQVGQVIKYRFVFKKQA